MPLRPPFFGGRQHLLSDASHLIPFLTGKVDCGGALGQGTLKPYKEFYSITFHKPGPFRILGKMLLLKLTEKVRDKGRIIRVKHGI